MKSHRDSGTFEPRKNACPLFCKFFSMAGSMKDTNKARYGYPPKIRTSFFELMQGVAAPGKLYHNSFENVVVRNCSCWNFPIF